MGAQIAAHLANAGIPVVLFDLAAKEGDPNGLVAKAIAGLARQEPAPLAAKDRAASIEAANYGDGLGRLGECDLVIEAIAERLDWKRDLYEKIAPHVAANAILASNTSGLSLAALSAAVPAALRTRFCGIHFFNPPRYMYLVELIAAPETDAALLDALEAFLTTALGKGVIRAKDTPNFIANRIGIFSVLATMKHTEAFGLGFDVVDALTGPAIGRAKSATYRTADVVGLDTMAHVVKTMFDTLPDDPWHALFATPPTLAALVAQGALGAKAKAGFFRKVGKDIQVLDPAARDYRAAAGQVAPEVAELLKIRSPAEKFAKLRASAHPQAQFLWAIFRDLFHYSAYHLRDDCRQCTRRGPGHPLGLRLADGSVRDVAGRRVERRRRLVRRGHRGGQDAFQRAVARVGHGCQGERRGRRAHAAGRVFGRERCLRRATRSCRSIAASSIPIPY